MGRIDLVECVKELCLDSLEIPRSLLRAYINRLNERIEILYIIDVDSRGEIYK